jgi:hypothetical protein
MSWLSGLLRRVVFRGSGVRFPARAGNFSLLHRVQTGSETHPVSSPMGTGDSFPAATASGA